MSQPPSPIGTARLERLALAALFLGAIAVGASAIFFRLNELEPLPSAFYRPFLAIPLLWLWTRIEPGRKTVRRPSSFRDYGGLLLAGAFFGGDLAFWHLSLDNTNVANATLFANAGPIFIVVFGWLLFRQRVTMTFLGGMAIAIAGAACLVGGTLSLRPENLLGDAYGLATAVFFASYLMALERLRTTFSTATAMLWTSIGTAGVLLPLALATGEPMIPETAFGWSMLLALAVVSQVTGLGMVVYALAHLPVSFASIGLLLEPIAVMVMGIAILGEGLSLWQIAGAAIILSGIYVARRGGT